MGSGWQQLGLQLQFFFRVGIYQIIGPFEFQGVEAGHFQVGAALVTVCRLPNPWLAAQVDPAAATGIAGDLCS